MMLSLLLAHSVNFITLPYDPISLLIVMVTFAVNAILIAHYETTRAMFETQSKMYHQELQEINNTLEVKIEKEIQKGQKKDALLSRQSKMAGMGEMQEGLQAEVDSFFASFEILTGEEGKENSPAAE